MAAKPNPFSKVAKPSDGKDERSEPRESARSSKKAKSSAKKKPSSRMPMKNTRLPGQPPMAPPPSMSAIGIPPRPPMGGGGMGMLGMGEDVPSSFGQPMLPSAAGPTGWTGGRTGGTPPVPESTMGPIGAPTGPGLNRRGPVAPQGPQNPGRPGGMRLSPGDPGQPGVNTDFGQRPPKANPVVGRGQGQRRSPLATSAGKRGGAAGPGAD